MLSLWKRKPEPQADLPQPVAEAVKRGRQQNIKVSEDCAAMFAALAKAQGISKAALFEDMVAERLETLQRQGVKVGALAG
jgi:hypothetical protein